MAQYWGEMARHLADALVLPFNVAAYASRIQEYYNNLMTNYGAQISQHHSKALGNKW